MSGVPSDVGCASRISPREWSETTYVVAAWWRDDGYGGTHRCETREDAEGVATEMIGQGYGNGSRGGGDEVRILEVRKTWTAWSKPNGR
jgi:hypothetical protein